VRVFKCLDHDQMVTYVLLILLWCATSLTVCLEERKQRRKM